MNIQPHLDLDASADEKKGGPVLEEAEAHCWQVVVRSHRHRSRSYYLMVDRRTRRPLPPWDLRDNSVTAC